MKTFSIDFTRLPSSGHGTIRIPTDVLHVDEKIGVYDEDTETFEATVLAVVSPGLVEVQIHWDRVLRLV